MDQKYELDNARYEENGHHNLIAVLTGCDIEDIIRLSPTCDKWHTSDYIKVIQGLGYNTNPRFVKFQRDSYYPCIMRYHKTDIKDPYWYGWAYYDNEIYYGCSMKVDLDTWLNCYGHRVKITSMLQVWIETTQKLNERTDKA